MYTPDDFRLPSAPTRNPNRAPSRSRTNRPTTFTTTKLACRSPQAAMQTRMASAWLDLGGQVCIHGSPDKRKPTDKGCISLANDYATDPVWHPLPWFIGNDSSVRLSGKSLPTSRRNQETSMSYDRSADRWNSFKKKPSSEVSSRSLAVSRRPTTWIAATSLPLHPKGANLIAAGMLDAMEAAGSLPDAVGGMAIGADPISPHRSSHWPANATYRSKDSWYAKKPKDMEPASKSKVRSNQANAL